MPLPNALKYANVAIDKTILTDFATEIFCTNSNTGCGSEQPHLNQLFSDPQIVINIGMYLSVIRNAYYTFLRQT